jgi:hypothetical protein
MKMQLHGRVAENEPPVLLPQILITGGPNELEALASFLHGVAADMRTGGHQNFQWRYDIPDVIVYRGLNIGDIK